MFMTGIRTDDILDSDEIMIENALKFQIPIWLVSMVMRKTVDILEYGSLFLILSSHGLPDTYIELLNLLYI